MAGNQDDLYATLGVKREATDTEISKAYKGLARAHHPDKGGDEETFKKIQRAYDVLGDKRAREHYDMTGSIPGEDGGAGAHGGAGMPFGFNMADLFGMFGGMRGGGGGGPRRKRPGKAPPRIERLPLSLSQLYHGGTLNISLNREKFCSTCKGDGSKVLKTCDKCGGSGQTVQHMMVGPGMMVQSHGPCGDCGGKGEQKGEPCVDCKGAGLVRGTKSLEVRIQPGMSSGDVLVFENEASDMLEFEKGSDLQMIIESADDANNWMRQGDNLRNTVQISLAESLCGTFIPLRGHPSVPADKTLQVEIPRGIQNGEEVIVPGRGMPKRGQGGFGHLYLKVSVVVSEAEQRVLVESAESVKAVFSYNGEILTGDDVWKSAKAL